MLLGGEPGVGKTRLAREVQRLARSRGCLTLTGQCYEQEGAPPFGPVAERLGYSFLPPLIDLWRGHHLVRLGPHAAVEGTARLRSAATGFASLTMPLHEALARRWLSESPR